MIPYLDLKAQYRGIKDEIDAAVLRVLDSTQFILGEEVAAFEREFATYCQASESVGVNSGTSALHLALLAAGIGPGDEVITTPFTFVATVAAIRYAGATPVFVDIEPDFFTIDPSKIESAITGRTRAIIPVHLYGHPADMPQIMMLAEKHQLHVIEDAAEAHGAAIAGRRAGSLGHCGVFSFYGNKIITSGEGGMITTDNPDIYARARFLRDHAMSKDVRYWHTEVGYNYRMTNIQAALGLAQLEQIDDFIRARAELLSAYRARLEPAGVICNPRIGSTEPVNWITCALIEGLGRTARDQMSVRLRERGVDTRPFFFPMSNFPMYAAMGGRNPVSASLSEDGFNLPTFVDMTEDTVAQVCDAFLQCRPGYDEMKKARKA